MTTTAAEAPPGLRRRRGLRFRLVVVFALGGFALSALLGVITYSLTQSSVIHQREQTATRQAFLNARLVRDVLTARTADAKTALASLDLPSGSRVVLDHHGRWFGTSVAVSRDNVPGALRSLVGKDSAGRQLVDLRSEPNLVVGVPLPAVSAGYYEVFALDDVSRTLRSLALALASGAAVATLVSGLMGWWVARRVLRPVRDVSLAAARIASGDLDTRLATGGDPDLDGLTRSFNQMVDALSNRIARDARFTADVTHELRSPLTTLAGATELMLARRDALGERDRTVLDLMAEEVHRFQRVVEELLELGRDDAGVARIELEPVRLAQLVLHVTENAAREQGQRSIAVEIGPEVADASLLLDKRRVERILVNLLENARAYAGGATAVSADRDGDLVRVTIDDRGPGVSESEREKVFERFFRGAVGGRRGASDGTGLGLSLVAEHARLHGGRAWVEDAPGGGARFVVELPWRRS